MSDTDNFFVAVSFPEDEKSDDLIELAADEWDALSAHFRLVADQG